MKKYYILKRNSESLLNSYLADVPDNKPVDSTKPLILIEKAMTKDDEHYNRVMTISEGVDSLLYDIIKNNVCYDYTAAFCVPIVHVNKKACMWNDYNKFK